MASIPGLHKGLKIPALFLTERNDLFTSGPLILTGLAVMISKGLVAGCHSFCLFFIFYNIHTFIHSITFIQYIYPSPFVEASLHFLIACLLSGEKPPCGAEPRIERIELGPALQQADALPIEPRRTMLSHAAPLLSHAAPLLSHAAP